MPPRFAPPTTPTHFLRSSGAILSVGSLQRAAPDPPMALCSDVDKTHRLLRCSVPRPPMSRPLWDPPSPMSFLSLCSLW